MGNSISHTRQTPYWFSGMLLACLSLAGIVAGQFGFSSAPAAASPAASRGSKGQVRQRLGKLPLSFEANRGQAHKKVDFIARGPGYNLLLTRRGALLNLFQGAGPGADAKPGRAARHQGEWLAMRLVGANPNAQASPVGTSAARSNYLIGSDPKAWHTNIPNYPKVRYGQVYPGVDLVYYGNQRSLEFDFLVSPGADPRKIRLGFGNARKLTVAKSGDLVVQLKNGEVRQHKPVVYQESEGKRIQVAGNFRIDGASQVGFDLGAYDRSKTLVIDPILRYSTYLGGSDGDFGAAIAVNAAGEAYVTGTTTSFPQNAVTMGTQTTGLVEPATDGPALTGFPTTGGAFQASDPDLFFIIPFRSDVAAYNFNSYNDVFVTKFNAAGSGLVYSTYFGGGGDDNGNAIAVTPAGEAVVTGSTGPPNSPHLQGIPLVAPIQSRDGGGTDALVFKLNTAGSFPIFSTYLGGSGDETGRGVSVDGRGNIALTGSTSSTNFTTFTPAQPALSGPQDAFVTNLNASGSAFNYSTYLGGTGNEVGWAIATDEDGNVYVAGETNSTNFPTTSLAFQQGTGGGTDAFVVKLNPTASQELFGTYLGGAGTDVARGIALDPDRNVYVTGSTTSNPFPLQNAQQPTFGGGLDAFVTKFDSGATSLVFSTYLGGSGADAGNAIAVSAGSQAYVTGVTSSFNFPILNHMQASRLGSPNDAFVTKYNRPGTAFEYSTYLGGVPLDFSTNTGSVGNGIAVDSNTGTAFVTGTTNARDFPNTLGAFQRNLSRPSGAGEPPGLANQYGGYTRVDVFVTRLGSPPLAPTNLTVTFVGLTRIDLAWNDNSDNEQSFEIEMKKGTTGQFAVIGAVGPNTVTFSATGLIPTTQYMFRVRAINQDGQSAYSNPVTISTLPQLPKDPTQLVVTPIDRTRLKLDWTDNSNNESLFKIERKLPTDPAFVEIATVGENVTTFTDTGLTPNTTYQYRVRAFNVAGNSGYTNTASGTTLPDPPTVAPSGLTATAISNSEIDLSWVYTPTDATGFKIYRSTNGVIYTLYRVTTTPATSFQDTGLPAKTKFFYKVAAYNISGDGPQSLPANATTLPDPPSAPTNLQATLVTTPTLKIDLTWNDTSTDEINFQLERSEDGGQTWTTTVVPTPSSPGTGPVAFSDTTVQNDRAYQYRVRAFNGAFSAYSNTFPIATPPNAPSNLSAQATDSTTVTLTFTDNSQSEVDFRIFRSTDGVTFNPLSATAPAANGTGSIVTFVDSTATQETNYSYQVRARNSAGSSAPSNTATATTLAAPTGLTATAQSQTDIALSFVDNSGLESGFQYERSTDPGFAPAATVVKTLAASGGTGGTVQTIDTGLTADTQYFYRVRAIKDVPPVTHFSSYSNTANARTLRFPPARPTGLTLQVLSQTSIRLTFTDNADNEDGFIVQRAPDGSQFQDVNPPLGPSQGVGGTVTFTDTGLTANTLYHYRVFAFNNGGRSAPSDEASAQTLPNPPAAPGSLTIAAGGQNRIDLSWTDGSDNELGFRVERSTDGINFTMLGTTLPARPGTGQTVVFSDQNLALDTQYFYRVWAFNAGGDSAHVGPVSLVTSPAAPSNLRLSSITDRSIRLFWVNNSTTVTKFKIERRVGAAGNPFVPLTEVPAPTTTFQDTGLQPNTQYTYRVKASNSNPFDSDYSNEEGATTLPSPPASPSAVSVRADSQTQLTVSWTDQSSNEDGFRVERSDNGGATWKAVGSVGASIAASGSMSFKDGGLQPNTTYQYRVTAFNAGGTSAPGGPAQGTTLGNTPPPPAQAAIASITLSPASLRGGRAGTGTVTLTMAAPRTGARVTLASNNSVVTVPATLLIRAGATSARFSFRTRAARQTTSVTLTGTYNGSKTATLTVTR